MKLSNDVRALLEGPNLAHLATVMPDGSPHVAPVWIDFDGRYVLVTTVEGVVKLRNIRRDPRVALSIVPNEDPYSVATLRGRVIEITGRAAQDVVDRMAAKYLGVDSYQGRPGQKRLTLKIDLQSATARTVTVRRHT